MKCPRLQALALAALLLSGCAGVEPNETAPAVVADPLALLGIEATSGAAPGYVKDEACRTCHGELWRSYQEVGMSRSFYRPQSAEIVEDLGGEPFFHEASGRYYEMRERDGRLLFRRYQRDAAGEPINLFEVEVDWILGSGNHARSYLYRTELGELYLLPINWYTQTEEWGMAPGFEHESHLGVRRLVRQECMFCHNAYPEVPVGNDHGSGLHLFPEELPEGTGCQRCHGPGAEHIRAALSGGQDQDREKIRAAIVNPGELEPTLRNDVCYECHMQPSIVLTSVTRFDRPEYSFRPGQSLADYKVALDPVLQGEDRAERFEINHHPYRLEQSACFRESRGELSCLTCHDPHRKVPQAERAEHYRAACAGCHDLKTTAFEVAHATTDEDPATSDCTSCHMPERRTQDVVLVTMTDHLIRRVPGGPELTAPIEKVHDPTFTGVELLYPERAPEGGVADIYRAVATLRTAANEVAADYLEQALPASGLTEPTAWLDLAQGQILLGRLERAKGTLERVLAQNPGHALAREFLGLTYLLANRPEPAAEQLRMSIELNPRRAEAHYNLGLALIEIAPEQALAALNRAIELRPNYAKAWQAGARTLQRLGRLDEAERHYRRALELEPGDGRSYLDIATVLEDLGRPDEALRYLRHGSTAPNVSESMRELLRTRARNAG